MTGEDRPQVDDAETVEVTAPVLGGPVDPPDEPRDTHYEVALDEEEPARTREPVYVDVVAREHERRPIVPAAWRPANLRTTLRYHAGRLLYVAGYHAPRSVLLYLPLALFWAPIGALKLVGRQIRWWWHPELHAMLQHAASTNDLKEGLKVSRELADARRWRGMVLGAELAAVAAVALVLALVAPRWVALLAATLAVPFLARVGRPVDRPIIHAAVVTPRFRKLSADIVLRAYYAAGLGHPEKPDQQVRFGSTMARDGDGSRVLVDLPYGKGLDDAVGARTKIASGLDVSVSQVFITRDPTSHRRHQLWVADRDPLALPAGRTPLLRCAPTDIWRPAPFGLNERGGRVELSLLWNSILVGAQPRQGKTFSARSLALYAALDPHVKLSVFDGKGSPDWRKFSLVADRYAFGLAMSRDGDPVELFIQALRDIKADVQDRYQRLSELPAAVCPEGKLTRDIARDPKYGMPVRLVVIDEFQEYFDLGDDSKEIARLLVFLVKVAPAAGVIVLGATQKPSGVGTGQVAQAFTAFRDNHQIRFSLRTGSWQVSDLVLGSGAYSEGFDSSTLLPEYKGVGILRGASDATPTVRTYLADQQDAEKILLAARAYRQQAGTLTGMAAGDDAEPVGRDVLRDVHGVFYAGEAFISWQTIAARLTEQLPGAYAGTTPEAISATLRQTVPSKDGKETGSRKTLKGARREHVEQALQRREIEGSR